MQKPVEQYWKERLKDLKKALENNNFEVYIADTAADAKDIVIKSIVPQTAPKTVSWGGSMTLSETGLHDALLNYSGIEIFNPYAAGLSKEDSFEMRRKALLADLYLTGSNAITEDGMLVNLDAFGNRVAALAFGPKNVVVVAGRNKLVPGLEEAMQRIKNYAAPINAMRLDRKTPCVETSVCQDCRSPERICSVWTITEKSCPKNRIRIILINQDLGF
jgi:L-lactate utilization protein LutB